MIKRTLRVISSLIKIAVITFIALIPSLLVLSLIGLAIWALIIYIF